MGAYKRSRAWLKKYNDLKTDDFPDVIQKRVFRFKAMRLIVLVAASVWLFAPTFETLVLGGVGAVCLMVLTQFIEPRLDRDIAECLELKKLHDKEEKE